MTKWWKKALDKVGDAFEDVGDAFEDVGDKIEDGFDSMVDSGMDLVKSGDCYQTIKKLSDNGTECYTLAKETTELCLETKARGKEMVEFGEEITSTLRGFSSKMDVDTLETIKDLMDGDRLRESMELCKEMDDIALSCVDKSVRMMDIMEDTLDSVPDSLQKVITKAAGQDDKAAIQEKKRSMEVLSTLDDDLKDAMACVDALQHLDIASALALGTRAFEHLSAKLNTGRAMFKTIRTFSEEVQTHTRAINDGDVSDMFKLIGKCKDVWHCLALSSLMKDLAEGAGKLIKVVIDLFKAMSDRLSTLWAALAFAKDCMMDCIKHVTEAKDLVLNAREKSTLLIERSKSIAGQLEDLGDFNKKSLAAAQKLAEGNEIEEAVELATNMDDLVLECTEKVVSMVGRVTEGFQNLPEIITADIDVEQEGKKDDDPEVDDIEENVRDLEATKDVIDKEDVIKACRESYKSFQGIMDNEEVCKGMLSRCEGFSGDCHGTIQAFLGVWDLESAMEKISEMCRVIRLGEMIKEFAASIKRLLKAIIALLKSMIKKLSIENLTKVQFDDIVDGAKEALEDLTDKLKFWD